MDKSKIENIVDSAFNKAISAVQPKLNMELYPAAFADEHTWIRVQRIIDLNNSALKNAVKIALSEILCDPS